MHKELERRAVGPVAVAAVAVATALNAFGVYRDGSGGDSQGTREFLIVSAIIALAVAAVFGWIVPRALRRDAVAVPALVLSILGLVTVAVFWSGITPALAAGGALLGWAGRNEARGAALCRAAMAIGVLALVADIVVYVLDWTA
jgi:hypothetical protein